MVKIECKLRAYGTGPLAHLFLSPVAEVDKVSNDFELEDLTVSFLSSIALRNKGNEES